MQSEMIRYAAIMLAAGIGIPVLAGLNAALGVRLGNPAAAAICLFAVAFLGALAVFLATGGRGLGNVLSAPPHLFLAGLLVAFYVLSITWVAPHFGVGNAVLFVLLGQVLSAAIIDHFGLFGAPVTPISLWRFAGLLLMAVGIYLAQKS